MRFQVRCLLTSFLVKYVSSEKFSLAAGRTDEYLTGYRSISSSYSSDCTNYIPNSDRLSWLKFQCLLDDYFTTVSFVLVYFPIHISFDTGKPFWNSIVMNHTVLTSFLSHVHNTQYCDGKVSLYRCFKGFVRFESPWIRKMFFWYSDSLSVRPYVCMVLRLYVYIA
jgi:hypothetical protein